MNDTHECEECGIVLTFEEWPEDESCPVCNPYDDISDLDEAITFQDWE